MDYRISNRAAWNEEVERGNWWTRPVSSAQISNAREGRPEIWFTPVKTAPYDWILPLRGKDVLNACGGGGQQTPLLAALGANVTVIDISPAQLEQDRKTLALHGLDATLVEGDVTSLPFPDASFDHIVNPCSLNFVENLDAVWDSFSRVLRKGGTLMTGIANPAVYLFDEKRISRTLRVKYTLPYSDLRAKTQREKERMISEKDTFEFSHTLSSFIGGLISRGFVLTGFYSDRASSEPLDSFLFDSYLAFRFQKTI